MQALHIAVIADDITGAADTGVQFCPAVGSVYLATGEGREFALDGIGCGGLAVSTDSRHVGSDSAAVMVREAWTTIRPLAPALVYKKIDSVLRGNTGAEIDALCLATSSTASFIAPAFPSQGRITEDDIHRVDGVPVAETEFARDPRCPVSESRLSVLLSAGASQPVAHVDITCIEKGVYAMAARVRQLLSGGTRHIAFDAVRDDHLDAIVQLAREQFSGEKILMAGSAGLAERITRHMAHRSGLVDPADRPVVKNWFFVCGSTSRVMEEQITELVNYTGWPRLQLDPVHLAANDLAVGHHLTGSRLANMANMPSRQPGSGTILSIMGPKGTPGSRADPGRIIAGMATVAHSWMSSDRPQGLFLSGGDTAAALLTEIGAEGVRLNEQILPGLMLGEIVGGAFSRLPVVTKAGAFGTADTLVQLINNLK